MGLPNERRNQGHSVEGQSVALSGNQGLSWWPSGWSSTRDGGSPAAHASVTMLIESAVTATWSVHASSPWNGLGVASGVHNWQGTPAAAAALSSSATAACAAAGVRREVVTSRLPAKRRTAPSAECTKARALSSVSSGASGRCHQLRDTVRPRRIRSHQSTIRAQSLGAISGNLTCASEEEREAR